MGFKGRPDNPNLLSRNALILTMYSHMAHLIYLLYEES